MDDITNVILAIVTTNRRKIGGGAPIFSCEDNEEKNNIASNLEAILDALAHEVDGETIILVKH